MDVIHFPRLDTVLMVEEFIRGHSGEYKKKSLWENLPKKMMYQTYSLTFDYLERSGKIGRDQEDKVAWIYNPKLAAKYTNKPLLSPFCSLSSLSNLDMKAGPDFKKETQSIAEQVWRRYKPQKIVLFGSCARGNPDAESDIDLLIVKDTQKRRVERVKEVLSMVDYNLPFDPIIYTQKELDERKKIGDPFIEKVIKEGKTLYGN